MVLSQKTLKMQTVISTTFDEFTVFETGNRRCKLAVTKDKPELIPRPYPGSTSIRF